MNYQGYFNQEEQQMTWDFENFWFVQSNHTDVFPSDCPFKPDGWKICEYYGEDDLKSGKCEEARSEEEYSLEETYNRWKIEGPKLTIDFTKPLNNK